MKCQITVLNETGEKIGMTYERRAVQLVEKGRARWLSERQNAVCLFDSAVQDKKEEETLGIYEPKGNNTNDGHYLTKKDEYAEAEPLSHGMIEEDLYKLAKSRTEERFYLTMHLGAFLVCQIVFLIVGSMHWFLKNIIILADTGWFIGVFMHALYCLAKTTPKKIQKEYDKLSRRR